MKRSVNKIDIPLSGRAIQESMDPRFLDSAALASRSIELAGQCAGCLSCFGLYSSREILSIREGKVRFEDGTFDGNIIAENLKETGTIFPFLVTGGHEAEAWASGFSDYTDTIIAHDILRVALFIAMDIFTGDLRRKEGLGPVSIMNPGSLRGWEISEQRKILDLLQPRAAALGVSASAAHVIHPAMTLTGVIYESESVFVNCQLCPKSGCAMRRCPFDGKLYAAKYHSSQVADTKNN